MRKNKQVKFDYDNKHDVLYISINEPRPSYSEEILPDVYLRRGFDTDEITGVTIINIKHQLEIGLFSAAKLPLGISEQLIMEAIQGNNDRTLKEKH